jgi:hypothetical protein
MCPYDEKRAVLKLKTRPHFAIACGLFPDEKSALLIAQRSSEHFST